jgi:8-oxo-dGTP diphosphatase
MSGKIQTRLPGTKGNGPTMIEVAAGILVRDSKILIAKRKAGGELAGKWEFPGGKIESGETPEACLKRELTEELGIKSTVGDHLWDGTYHYDFGTVRLLVYRVYWEGDTIVAKDHEEYKWVTPADLKEYDFAPADLPFVERLVNGDFCGYLD